MTQSMEKVLSIESVIEYLLNTREKNYDYDERRCTVFIQSSVLPKWQQWITKHLEDVNFLDLGQYKFRIIDNVCDVHLISISQIGRLQLLSGAAYFACNWKKNKAIFTDLAGYSRLKEFICKENQEEFVKAIQTWHGIGSQNEIIKIVTFRQTNNDSIFMFLLDEPSRKILDQVKNCPDFCVCQPFPWFDPLLLPLFDKQSVNDEFFVGLITFLQCQRELCYDLKTEFSLNVIELCALKLAFCPEFGIESRACTELALEIDDLIIDLLNRLAKDNSNNGYIRDNHFNLFRYANDREFDLYTQELACFYFIYNFQDWIKLISIPSLFLETSGVISINLVKEHQFVLSRLSKLPTKYRCEIDGTDFSGMDFKLFYGILTTGSVDTIILDTNYRWLNANEPKFLYDNKTIDLKVIEFIGDNQFNLMEDCIECLKFFESSCDNLWLNFKNPNFKNYVILKNLHVEDITFTDLTITTSILRELIACEFHQNQSICFDDCRIEDVQTWTLLNEFNFFKTVVIIEEEKTWQYFFDFILNQMKESQLNEFIFKKSHRIKTQNGKIIRLEHLKYGIDESESRLQLRDSLTNQTVDLYDLKNEVMKWKRKEEDLISYDFYQ